MASCLRRKTNVILLTSRPMNANVFWMTRMDRGVYGRPPIERWTLVSGLIITFGIIELSNVNVESMEIKM